MFCINCGQEISEEAKFCFNCGSQVKSSNHIIAKQKEESLPVRTQHSTKSILNKYFEDNNQYGDRLIIYGTTPISQTIKSNINLYCNEEKPLMIFNYGKNAAEGFIVTESHFISFYSGKKIYRFNLHDIETVAFSKFGLAGVMELYFSDGFKSGRIFLTGLEKERNFVYEFQNFLEEYQSKREKQSSDSSNMMNSSMNFSNESYTGRVMSHFFKNTGEFGNKLHVIDSSFAYHEVPDGWKKYCEEEKPIMIFNYRNGSEGFVITEDKFIMRYYGEENTYDLFDIEKVAVEKQLLIVDYMKLYFFDKSYSEKLCLGGIDNIDVFVDRLNEFFKILNQE